MKVKFLPLIITSRVQAFFDWWLEGLTSICPAFIKSAVLGDHGILTVEFDQKMLSLKYFIKSSDKTADNLNVTLGDQESEAAAISWINYRLNEPCKTILLLADEVLLTKELQFPAAALSNIDDALKFEISRKTPFTLEQVYYDYSVSNHAAAGGQITVFLATTPKINLDKTLAALNSLHIKPDFASTESLVEDKPDINLLPKEHRPLSGNNTFSRFSFVSVTILMLVAALCVPILEQSLFIKTIESELLEARKDALEYSNLAKEKEQLLSKINFLSNMHFSTISSIRLLNEVSVLLPDNTWIFRFSLNNNVLQIQGESTNASELIKILETSLFFENVRFTSPTTKNNSTKKDKFHLSADVIVNS